MRTFHDIRAPLLAVFFALPAALHAQAGVRVGLTYSSAVRPGVYVLPMQGERADSINAIVARDLDFGNRLTVIAADTSVAVSTPLNYPLYATLGAAAVLQLKEQAPNRVQVVLHDVAAAKVLQQRLFPLDGDPLGADWRQSVHRISDEVERWITGTPGIAATRILFTRAGSIWMVDSDGANARPVPGVGSGQMPAWHPNGRMMAYMSQGDEGSQIVLHDLATGTARRLTATDGLNITPAFAPDGRSLAYSSGNDGTDLFTVSLNGDGARTRVTVGRGTENVSPSFSPDGRRIAFTSGRLGRPEIYISDADGANPQWLTTTGFGDQSYRSDPSWAPDGKHVAFQTQIEGRFQVATINLRDRSVKQHTIEGINEQPSWAPDSRHVVFTSNRSGTRQLWVLDMESGRMRQLTHGASARMGAWSPRLSSSGP